MKSIDWDKYPDAEGGINWDKYADAPDSGNQNISAMNALDRGFTEIASGGLRDEAAGAVKNPIGALKQAGNYFIDELSNRFNQDDLLKQQEVGQKIQVYKTNPVDQDIQEYVKERNESRRLDKLAKSQHPWWYGLGQVGGGAAASFIPGIRAAGPGIGAAIESGAIQGGLTGFGSSEGESLGQLANDAALGAGAGGAGGAIGYGIGKGIGAIRENIPEGVASYAQNTSDDMAERIRDYADIKAAKGMGVTKRFLNKPEGLDKAKEIGRYGLDEGIISGLASPETMAQRNESALNGFMQQRQPIYDIVDDAGASTLNAGNVAKGVESELGGFNQESPLNRGMVKTLKDRLQAIGMRGEDINEIVNLPPEQLSAIDQYLNVQPPVPIQKVVPVGKKNISLNEGQKLVEELKQGAHWSGIGNQSPEEILAQKIYMKTRDALNNAAEESANKLGISGAGDLVRNLNKKYSIGLNADTVIRNKLSSEIGNKSFGLTDTMLGAGELASENPSLGKIGTLLGIKKASEKYGNQVLAQGADKLADIVAKAPQTLGRYSGVLQNAAQRGGQSLAITNYVLQQSDPEYRKHINNIFDIPQDSDQ